MEKHTPHKIIALVLFALFTATLVFISLYQFHIPDPSLENIKEEDFSAFRAKELLAEFASQPHPTGTAAAQTVRQYLIDQLGSLGIEAQVQSTVGVLAEYGVLGQVENVVARILGTDSSGAVLLMAHYDTVQPSPGASDNGTGVAVILEVLRALQSEQPLKNDVIILFTDAEEYGTLGAQAFVSEHPWMKDVAVVLNIEGAMNGPIVMIETGLQNGWFVNAFNQASSRPIGFSWVYDLYLMLPYLTDFTPFKNAGLAGGNLFAYNGGPEYHTPFDDLAHVTMSSFQHHGEQTLELTKHFGQVDLRSTHQPDVVYFNLLGKKMIVYPKVLVKPLAVLALIAYIVALAIHFKKHKIAWKDLLLGFLIFLAEVVLATLVVVIGWNLLQKWIPELTVYFPTGHFYQDIYFMIGAICLSAAVIFLVNAWLGRKISQAGQSFGAAILWVIFNILCAFVLPGFSYLFTLPLLFFSLSKFVQLASQTTSKRINLKYLNWFIFAFSYAVLMLLWVPVLSILYSGTAMAFVIAIPFIVALMVGLSRSQVMDIFPKGILFVGVFFLILAAGSFLYGATQISFDEHDPQPNRLRYIKNADSQQAYWAVSKQYLSDWEQQFLKDDLRSISYSEIFPVWQSSIFTGSADLVDWQPPQIMGSTIQKKDDGIQACMEIDSVEDAPFFIFGIAPGIQVSGITFDGRSAYTADALSSRRIDDWLVVQYVSFPVDGVQVCVQTQEQRVLTILLADWYVSLPKTLLTNNEERPASVFSLGDESIVFTQQEILLD